MLSLAIDMRSSELPALLFIPLILVKGVLAPLTEPAGVDVEGESSPLGPPPAFFFAAFSASRFCFDAEGAIALTVVDLQIDGFFSMNQSELENANEVTCLQGPADSARILGLSNPQKKIAGPL
jgi:hypothetical protein